MKYYFFRDLDHQGNLLDGRTHHAAGYVNGLYCELNSPNSSGKDVAVTFMDPFTGFVRNQWRALDEIELFEVSEWEHKRLQDIHSVIDEAKKNY